MIRPIVFCALMLSLCACSQKYYYARGLRHAQTPASEAVYNGLTVVSHDNKSLTWDTIGGKEYVLAVSWKADTSYYTKNYNAATGCYAYNTGKYPIFVTMAPYLKQMALSGMSNKKLETRLDQLLGLPPQANYSYFLEIWVRPEDIIRPCFDPATNTNVCEYSPSAPDAARTDYMAWLYQYIYNSYCDTNMMGKYPFTHLGYTYDWNPRNKSHVGLSEFVIRENKDIYIKRVYTTHSYFE